MNGRSIDGEATDDPDNVVREIKQNGNASRRELRREGLKKRKRRKMVTPEFSHGRCRAPEPSFKSLTRSPRTFFCEGIFYVLCLGEVVSINENVWCGVVSAATFDELFSRVGRSARKPKRKKEKLFSAVLIHAHVFGFRPDLTFFCKEEKKKRLSSEIRCSVRMKKRELLLLARG